MATRESRQSELLAVSAGFPRSHGRQNKSRAAAFGGAIIVACVLAGCQVGAWQDEPATFYAINGCTVPIQATATVSTDLAGWSTDQNAKPLKPGEQDTWRSDFDLAHAGGALYLWVAAGDSKKWPSEPTAHIALTDMTVDKSNPNWPDYTYVISGDLCPN